VVSDKNLTYRLAPTTYHSKKMHMTDTKNRKILLFENSYSLTNYLLKKWPEYVKEARHDHNYFSVAFSGGHTPVEFYCRLSNQNEFELWEKTHIFQADERFVSREDSNNNFKLIKDNLLNYLPLSPQQIHGVPVDCENVMTASTKYAEDIGHFFAPKRGAMPSFDLICLGLGEDGHTASLFPGGEGLVEDKRYTVPVTLNHLKHDRVSLTMSLINSARRVIFIVTGRAKAEVLKRVLAGDASLPASLVAPKDGELIFLVDPEAARAIPYKQSYSHEDNAIVVNI
jgi:6-phosphogluconolactonase